MNFPDPLVQKLLPSNVANHELRFLAVLAFQPPQRRLILPELTNYARNRRVRQALMTHGLNHELSEITRLALEQGVTQQMNEPDLELLCAYCKKNGHRSRDCTVRESAICESNQLSNDPLTHCVRCDSIGHSAYVCKVVPQSQNDQQRHAQGDNRPSNNGGYIGQNQNQSNQQNDQ